MLRPFAAFAFLVSAQAFACPQLAGNYTCNYQDGQTTTLVLNQDAKSNVTIYDMNGQQLPADNQVKPIPDEDSLKNATVRAWCNDDTTLHTEIVGKYYRQGQYFGDLTMDADLSMANQNLRQVTTGNVKNSGGTYPVNSDITCTRD